MFKSKNRQYAIFLGLAIFCATIFISGSVWFVLKNKNTDQSVLPTPVTSEDLLLAVGKLVALPVGEEPTIATVTDLTQLQQQEFFRQAKVGDRVIIYAKAGKAILYSPTENKIIEMAPLNKNLISP